MSAINKAIEIVGGRKALADALSVSYEAVRQWTDRRVPAERVLDIERLTGGQVTRHELRPDLYPQESAA